ncbi:protein STICHEL-like, partial [Typha latifolia]|uniref:protein STICHEL-like n=1 Tax=Typha latifolia TaxID=4733 RepID=UPI003C2C2F03
MAKCMRPSKLHLKKDLTSLRKPCFFWDPETFLTWRSTLRSRSMASSIYQKGASGNSAGSNKSISSRRERSKRVYLYNWKTHPTKSTDHGTKLSVDRQGLKTAGSEENIGNLMKKNLKSETSPDNNATSESIEVSERKTRRMPCRRAISGKQTFSVLSSIKEHGIKECCKSEDRTDDRRESSNTPWSYSSHNKYAVQSPEVAEKETFPNEDEVCQMKTHKEWIPCYWSKRTKDRAARNCYSSSPFNTVRRKERKNIFRSRKFNYKRTPSESHRQKQVRHSQAFPLLKSSYYQGGSSADYLSSSFGEHCLETLSQLNRRTWMNRSQEAQKFDLLGHDNKGKLEKRLSEKYRPRSFGEIIGQRNVVQSLSNAILKGKLGPALLFQGPRGTGKTSTARVLAASLNCLSTEEIKPCGFCKECTGIFAYQNGSNMKEVDATNKNAIDDVIFLLKNICATKMITHYEIFVIDRCDKLSLKIWSEFMKIFEEPPPHLIFIFVTSDPEKLPMPILARCQKYIFAIIKETDIVSRLRELSAKE